MQGAIFEVFPAFLNLADVPAPLTKALSRAEIRQPVSRHPSTILLVDDNDDTRELLAYVFEGAGFPVAHAASAEQAYAYLEAGNAPALVLTDIVLPNASGVDLVAYLRSHDSLRHTPVIVVTGRNPSDVDIAADAVLHKPVDPYALLATAKQVMAAATSAGPVRAGKALQDHNRLHYRTQELRQEHERLRHAETATPTDQERHKLSLQRHKARLAAHKARTGTRRIIGESR